MSYIQDAKNILDVLGYASTIVVIISTVTGVVLWFRGIMPVLLRLGNGLARRKIAIFAKGNMAGSLADMLHDSRLFDRANITNITNDSDVGMSEKSTLFVVYWPDWKDSLDEILRRKTDATAMIIYAPQDQGFIPPEIMAQLATHRNLIVSNFRGRLLNDIVASMITTSYEKN